ncbi:unnamed protein product [Linum tenue]|uniref:Uncharacterized protein n=1 Tax=Linum tenue TaxID=586396 RepID=A0AAV0MA85_9ROSI|nr:unnamed protein product [Linum tenue]
MAGLEKDPRRRSCSSKSESVTEPVTGSSQFTVKGYSLLKAMGRDKYLYSDIFSAGGYDWKITFNPNKCRPSDGVPSVYVGIALASSGGRDVRALFELTLLDHMGDNHFRFRSPESEPGFFVEKARLESSTFLKDDCLIIRASVGVVTTRLEVEGAKQDSIAVPSSNLGQGLKELLESQLGCDLVFRVGHETFRAHKSMLAARSPFFRAQFFGPVGDPDLSEVIVDDIHPSIFKAKLQFIYTDELPDVHEIMGSPSTYSSMSTEATNVMQHLLVAADLYDLDRLKAFCESKLCEELTAASVATTLALADQHHYVPQPIDNNDCGVFACLFMEHWEGHLNVA